MNKLALYKMITLVSAASVTGSIGTTRAETPVASTTEAKAAEALPATTPVDEDKWVFTAPLYIWAAGVNGSASAKGQSVNVDYTAGDVMNNTDVGFTGYFQLAKPQYGLYVAPTYMNLSNDGKSGPVKANLDTELWIVEFAAFYKFWRWEGDRPGALSGLAGGRYWSIHNELTVKAPAGTANAANSRSLCDPIIGLRYEQYFTKKFHAVVQGDIGGFDISADQSRFSWQVQPLLGYDFNMIVIHKPSTVFAGYRIINIQKSEGNGVNKESMHLSFEGVVIGLNVQLF